MTERDNKTQRRKKRIRIDYSKAARTLALLVLIIWLLVSLISPLAGAGTRYDRDMLRKYGDPEAEAPSLEASSVMLYSLDLDKPVYEKNADERMAPYSVTKILTCYLALETLDPDKVVTVSENASKVLYDGTTIYLKKGERISVKDLVYGAMLESGNDAATALGEAVSGNIKTFAGLMNDQAAEWGCENTHFVNANGWDHKKHYTTSRDLAVIARHCLENETLRKVSVTKKYTIPATNMTGERVLRNALLHNTKKLKGITGGKTGSWSKTQNAIAVEFTDKGFDGVIVLMGDTKKGRAADPKKLIKFSHEVTPGFLVSEKGDELCKAWVKHGAKTQVPLYTKALRYAYPKNGKAGSVRVKTEVEKLTAPVTKDTKAGKFYVYADKKLVGQGTLYTSADVEEGWFPSNLYISNSSALAMLLFILLSAVLVLLLKRNSRARRRSVSDRRRSRY